MTSITCIGASHWDTIAQATHPIRPSDDVPGQVVRRPGGVAYNIARALAARRLKVQLLTAVGADADGDILINEAQLAGIDMRHAARLNHTTDQYVAIEGISGDLFGAVADARCLEQAGMRLFDGVMEKGLGGIVLLDSNLTLSTLDTLVSSPLLRRADVRLVSASPAKVTRFMGLLTQTSPMIYANLAEANALLPGTYREATAAALALCDMGARAALVTHGAGEAAYADGGRVIAASPPPVRGGVTGAGDALIAGHVAAQIDGRADWDALNAGLRAAANHISGSRPA
ncbi:sugar/nucleoside kinase (ribokinase family) [Rubricella aquisinus]|uniref:Sugar/nucleoside kinase (Ribokinase family) n=1 Tax=Rubricella aquisinus TaxID=2028108 RepID=A0A840WHW6_9RHOB|nr:PfkB family carbohydrate kinase [Rubricella aquisinus]MBB5514709.1 sugar/nucleoside kinase (ribokinase family) [Rubricella aquisinus]